MKRFDGLVMIRPRTAAESEFIQRVGPYCRVDGIEIYHTTDGLQTFVKVRALQEKASMLMPLESINHAVTSIVCAWEVIHAGEWMLLTPAQIRERAFYMGEQI